MFRIILELFRILFVFLVGGSVLGATIKLIYASLGINIDNTLGGWLVGIAILITLFVLYKNWLQFSGFIKGESFKKKLPKKISVSLILSALILIILSPIFSY
jgi:hypothetical protein